MNAMAQASMDERVMILVLVWEVKWGRRMRVRL